jgi:1-acyl-sn-glycerol-3-phosphate acyltransferase
MEATPQPTADGELGAAPPPRRSVRTARSVVFELVRDLAPAHVVVQEEHTLAELGLDSLACADLAIAVEEQLGVRLPDVEGAELETVGHLVDAVEHGAPVRPRIGSGLGSILGVGRLLGGPVIRRYGRLRVEGAENLPPEGPVIIAADHRSMFDIPVMVVASPRPVYFMAKRELYGDPARAWLWHHLGGFPVRRQATDLRAIDTAMALLERGDAVALYPEGTRSRSGEMLPFLLGAAWLGLKTGAPVVPCGVIGTGVEPGWNGRSSPWVGKHVRVRFGTFIETGAEPDPRARRLKAEALTQEIEARIRHLMA